MNPPYDKNLHLKILQEAMKHSDDVVNLSPIRWLQDPLAEYKKASDWKKFENIRKHIENLDVVNGAEASKLFNITFGDLGIYHITKDISTFNASTIVSCPKYLVEKVALSGKHLSDVIMKDAPENAEHFIRMTSVYNTSGGTVVDKLITPDFNKAYNNADKNCATVFIPMNSRNEAYNLWASLHTKFMRYCKVKLSANQTTPLKFLPFMPTYTHPWTDADLYDYFHLTDEEIKEIEKENKNGA